MTNNVLAVGGGFFVKIKKHTEFYAFEEIVALIDGQNQKNVKRIQLDKQDKSLLKPLLVALLQKKAKKLSPEQQLLGAILSIVLKKAQVVMEVRSENAILVDRILEIVRQEKEATLEGEPQGVVQTQTPTNSKSPTSPVAQQGNIQEWEEETPSVEESLPQETRQADAAA